MPPFDVNILSADALLKVICDGNEVKFAPLPYKVCAYTLLNLTEFVPKS